MAVPAEQRDVGPSLVTQAGVAQVMDGETVPVAAARLVTMEDKPSRTVLAAATRAAIPQPASSPPQRRAHVERVERRVRVSVHRSENR